MIQIPRSVYEKFLRFAIENANPVETSKKWRECIGLILGRINGQKIEITDIIPIGAGTSVFVDITDYEKVFSLISVSRIDQGEVIVGWAHTHPGLGLFFSNTDIYTQSIYQKIHPLAFGLVLDPMKITSESPGFNIYRVDNKHLKAFTIDYTFKSSFNFLQIKDKLINEIYLKPPLVPTPIQHSDTKISWRNINIIFDGPSEIEINNVYQIKLRIIIPERQFVRIDYQIELKNFELTSVSRKSRSYFHETLSSGILTLKTVRSLTVGSSSIRIKKLLISNSTYQFQKLPDLFIKFNDVT